jgi:hypothetical protein
MLVMLVAAAAVASSLAAHAAQPDAGSQEPEVEMEDFSFRPARFSRAARPGRDLEEP